MANMVANSSFSISVLARITDVIGTAEQKIVILQQQINAYRKLSTSLAFDK